MSKRRTKTRIFPRAERAQFTAAQAAREAALTDEQRDERTAASAGFPSASWRDPQILADDWLALRAETDPTDEERAAVDALARQFERITGGVLTVDVADAYTQEEHRDA